MNGDIKEMRFMEFRERVKGMRKEGKEWSEVEDWITRQIGYDKSVLDFARKVFYGVEEVKEEKPPTEVPEGVTIVKFELYGEVDAESVETVFDAVMSGEYEFRSAVNLGTMVRTVMYKKGAKAGTPIQMVTTSKEMAWSLQQTIDWTFRKIIEVVAVRREGKTVEVAYIKKGIPAPPLKEKLIYHFKKTDGWTLVGEPKP